VDLVALVSTEDLAAISWIAAAIAAFAVVVVVWRRGGPRDPEP
jgi:hypothetical protein